MSTRTIGLLGICGALLAPASASAIPAFARKTGQSCTTCHAPFPRLRPYGELFAARGYRDEGAESARATVDFGDPLLALPRDLPVSIRFDGFADWSPERTPRVDFQTPTLFKLISGGVIAPRVSFYTYFIYENGGPIGIEDAWVQFSELLGLPVDFTVGQFQVCDPIVKRELRLLRLEYDILTVRPRLSATDLTYDRGLMLAWHAPAGVEAIATLTNGNGIGPAAETFDGDKFKTFSLRLARDLGPVRVGLFGAVGKARPDAVALAAGAAAEQVDTTVYWGPDLRVDLGDWGQVAGQWLSRRDSNAGFDPANGGATRTRGGWVEAVLTPQGSNGPTAITALYNRVTSDDPGAERESVGLGVSWLLARNVRLVAEVQDDLAADAWKVSGGTVLGY
jgi:hypothetical protein